MIKMAPQISEKRIISLVDGFPKKKKSPYTKMNFRYTLDLKFKRKIIDLTE